MEQYDTGKIIKRAGVALMAIGMMSSLVDSPDHYSYISVITGGATYIAGYLADCAHYLRAQVIETEKTTKAINQVLEKLSSAPESRPIVDDLVDKIEKR